MEQVVRNRRRKGVSGEPERRGRGTGGARLVGDGTDGFYRLRVASFSGGVDHEVAMCRTTGRVMCDCASFYFRHQANEPTLIDFSHFCSHIWEALMPVLGQTTKALSSTAVGLQNRSAKAQYG